MCFEHAFHHTIQIVDRTVLHQYIYDKIVQHKKLPIIFKGNLKTKTVTKSKSIKERKVTYVLMIPHYSLKYPWLYLVMLADMPYNYIFMADIFLYTPHRKQIICYIVSNKPLICYRFHNWLGCIYSVQAVIDNIIYM